MSATLVVALALALFGIVALLGFVGCRLARDSIPGEPQSSDPYRDAVNSATSLVAFWPLDESMGPTATDRSSHAFNGTYLTGLGASNYDAVQQSAAAAGNVILGLPGIVPGDALFDARNPCPAFDGGIVSVPFAQLINNTPPFTIEAWVLPGWTDADVQTQPALRGVVVSNDTSIPAGFGLFATPQNVWSFSVAFGSMVMEVKPPADADHTILLDGTTVYHLVVTYDGTVCTIFANTQAKGVFEYATGSTTDPDPTKKYVPLPASTPLFIGAGNPKAGTSPPPLFPFTGRIEDVAIYGTVLDKTAIQSHFTNGFGA